MAVGRPAARPTRGVSWRQAAAPVRRLGITRDFALGLTFVVLAFLGLVRVFAPHTVDDAWITFRYSRQWAAGIGPYFNPGEHVEGYSNFLLMLVLTPVVRFAGPEAALPVAKGIGLASALLAIVGAGLLARFATAGTRFAEVAGITAAALVAFATGFAYHAMSGLETALYACLLTWGVAGVASGGARSTVLGGVALAAAAVTRPEAPAVCALACLLALAARTWRGRAPAATLPAETPEAPPAVWRPVAIAGAIVLAAVVAQLVFRHAAYDGEWLPNTYYAKLGGSGDRVAYVHDALRAAFLGDVGLVAALLGWIVGGPPSRALIVSTLVGVAGAALPFATGGDWMPRARLVAPYLPLLAVGVACGWARFMARARRESTGLAHAAVLLAAPLNLGLGWGARADLEHVATVETEGARTGHAALAAWLRERAHPGDTVLLMDIGEVGYRCIEQRIQDVTGLTDRRIAKSPGTFNAKQIDPDVLWSRPPEFIVLAFLGSGEPDSPFHPNTPLHPFSPMEAQLQSDPRFQGGYVQPQAAAAPADDARARLRAALGAEEVFPYAEPGRSYFLAVYRRHG